MHHPTWYGYPNKVKGIHGDMVEIVQAEVKWIPAMLCSAKLIDEWPKLSNMIKGQSKKKLTTKKLCRHIVTFQTAGRPKMSTL